MGMTEFLPHYYTRWSEGNFSEPEVFRVSPKEPCQLRRFDIVLVHGFNGHYLETWQSNLGTFWPAWLLESIPNCRVLVVSYHAPLGVSEGPLFENISRGVLTALDNANVGSAPIVFICHSLGGLIVKRVLEIVADEKLGNIRDVTRAVVFFSTPHGGSNLANFASVFGENRLLKHLRDGVGEGPLDEFQQRFSAKIKSSVESGALHIFNFYEEKRVGRIRVVNPETARRGFEHLSSYPVPANHIWMVKFPRRQNQTYRKLCRMINEWTEADTQLFAVDDQGIDSCGVNDGGIVPTLSPEVIRSFGLLLLGAAVTAIAVYAWGMFG
jgi:pimeloyl-ACP methyl ester carboxylesterase